MGANTTGNVVDYFTALADVQVAQREERESELKARLHLVDPYLCHVANLHGSTGYGV